jgi:hypothetical protein
VSWCCDGHQRTATWLCWATAWLTFPTTFVLQATSHRCTRRYPAEAVTPHNEHGCSAPTQSPPEHQTGHGSTAAQYYTDRKHIATAELAAVLVGLVRIGRLRALPTAITIAVHSTVMCYTTSVKIVVCPLVLYKDKPKPEPRSQPDALGLQSGWSPFRGELAHTSQMTIKGTWETWSVLASGCPRPQHTHTHTHIHTTFTFSYKCRWRRSTMIHTYGPLWTSNRGFLPTLSFSLLIFTFSEWKRAQVYPHYLILNSLKHNSNFMFHRLLTFNKAASFPDWIYNSHVILTINSDCCPKQHWPNKLFVWNALFSLRQKLLFKGYLDELLGSYVCNQTKIGCDIT